MAETKERAARPPSPPSLTIASAAAPNPGDGWEAVPVYRVRPGDRVCATAEGRRDRLVPEVASVIRGPRYTLEIMQTDGWTFLLTGFDHDMQVWRMAE